jgi:hypothetical protein
MMKINLKNLNIFTILSVVLLLIGIVFYVYWGIRFGVWSDVGIYSITIFLVLTGLVGAIMTLYEKNEESI